MKVSEQLNLAADLIQVRGWNRDGSGWITEGTGPLCLEGGLLAAQGVTYTLEQYENSDCKAVDSLVECPTYLAVHHYLDLPENRRLFNWNDKTERTQEEVIEVLRAAAEVQAVREEALVSESA